MAFGQPSGPPATHRQLTELLELLQQEGHTGFRDARGPMGFTQRQGNGKFTRDEADAFIEELTEAAEARDAAGDGGADGDGPAQNGSTPGGATGGGPASRGASGGSGAAGTRRSTLGGAATAAERAAAKQARALRSVPSEVLAAELQRRGWAVIEP